MFKAYRLPYVVHPQRLLGFLTVWFTQVCIRCILNFKNTSGHFHVSSILVFLSIGIELRWLMMTDNENTRTQDRARTHIEKRPQAPSVKTVIIGYWWNRFGKGPSAYLCLRSGKRNFFYIQRVFVALSSVANYRSTVCWSLEHLWLGILFKLVWIHSPLNARFFPACSWKLSFSSAFDASSISRTHLGTFMCPLYLCSWVLELNKKHPQLKL